MKTAIVTGGTSGLGLAAAQTLAAKGLRVYALSRHGAPVPGVTSLACDITDADAVERTVAAIEAEAGRIDLVVNNEALRAQSEREFTFRTTIGELMGLFGEENVQTVIQEKTAAASYNPDYDRTASRIDDYDRTLKNVATNWFMLMLFAMFFALLAVAALEMIDRDKR